MGGGTRNERVIVDIIVNSRGADSTVRKMNGSLERVEKSAKRATNALAAIFTAQAAINLGKSVLEIAKLDANLRAVTKTSVQYDRALNLVRDTANDLGLEMRALESSYTMFYASAQASGIALSDIELTFTALATSAKAFSLSTADMEGAMVGLRQIANSSSVSLEDLRQVTDRIPGAWATAMDSIRQMAGDLSLTDDEVKKLISSSRVATDKFLPAFGQALLDVNADIAATKTDDLSSAYNRLTTSLDELQRAVAESGLPGFLADVADAARAVVEWIPKAVYWLAEMGREVQGLETIAEMDERIRQMLGDGSQPTTLAPIEVNAPRSGGITPGRSGGGGRSGGSGGSGGKSPTEKLANDAELAERALRSLKGSLDPVVAAQQKMEDQMETINNAMAFGLIPNFEEYDRLVGNVRDQTLKTVEAINAETKSLDGVADSMGSSFTRAFEDIALGAASAEDAVAGLLKALAGSVVKAGFAPIGEGISSGIGEILKGVVASADGNVFGSTGLPHGVYSQPTAFPIRGGGQFANGVGVLGEAGPEAIMPLTRRNGKLGVEGGGVNINVQNYAGADVQTRQGINPGDIDIIISRVAEDVARGGGPVGRSIESTYGIGRGSGRR